MTSKNKTKKNKIKKIVTKDDKKKQHKYQLIVASICFILITIITLSVYLIKHL